MKLRIIALVIVALCAAAPAPAQSKPREVYVPSRCLEAKTHTATDYSSVEVTEEGVLRMNGEDPDNKDLVVVEFGKHHILIGWWRTGDSPPVKIYGLVTGRRSVPKANAVKFSYRAIKPTCGTIRAMIQARVVLSHPGQDVSWK